MTCPCGRPLPPPPERTWQARRRVLLRALLFEELSRHQGNRTHTARCLGIQRTYLLDMLARLTPQATP